MKKTSLFVLAFLLLPFLPNAMARGKSSATATKITKETLLTKTIDRVGISRFFTMDKSSASSPLGGKGGKPGFKIPKILKDLIPCYSDSECSENTYCFIPIPEGEGHCLPPCDYGDCQEGFYCDEGGDLSTPDDNRCLPEETPTCPQGTYWGQNSTTGGMTCVPDDNNPPTPPLPTCGNNELDAGEACDDGNNNDGDGCSSHCEKEIEVPLPEGCVYLKVTQIAGHLVKIEYAFKKEIEDTASGVPVVCPAIDEAYIWGQMNKLNNDLTVAYVIKQPVDNGSLINSPNKTFNFDEEKPATKCQPDDSVCMGFGKYRDDATKPNSAVWTSHPDYPFANFPFYRVDVTDLTPAGEFDPPTLLGYANMKFFYDDNLDKEGKPTGNFTPRFYIVVKSDGKWYLIQGEVEILHPTADVTVTASTTSPIWKLSVLLHDGVFGLDEEETDASKILDGVVTPTASPCVNAFTSPTSPKSGYAATLSEDCALKSETISITLKMRGLNRFDYPIQTITYKLTPPTLTLKEIGCEQLLAEESTGELLDQYVSCKSVDTKGNIKLHYEVAERKVQLDKIATESDSQGSGEVKDNPPPPTTVQDESGIQEVDTTVPWIGKVTVTPTGFKEGSCKQDPKTVEIVTEEGTKGTAPEEELTFVIPGVAQGNLLMERSYECYHYELSATDLEEKEISTEDQQNVINVPYKAEFEAKVATSQCKTHEETHEDIDCDGFWENLCGYSCATIVGFAFYYACMDDCDCIDRWKTTEFDGLDYTVEITSKHVKEITPLCYEGITAYSIGNWYTGDPSDNISGASSPSLEGYQENIIFFNKLDPKPTAAKNSCAFFLEHQDGSKSNVELEDMPTCEEYEEEE